MEFGFRSTVALPLIHDDTVYGVLNVHSRRPRAFEGQEKAVIGQLGESVGHAIASIERKNALMSEEIVELTFQVRNAFAELEIPAEQEGTITFDQVVPLSDEEFLVYGTVTVEARASLAQITERLPRWEAVTFHDEDGDTRFELHLSEHTVLSTLADLGGTFRQAFIEDGNFRLSVQLPPSTNVRRLIDTVQRTYPGVEMVTRRQTTRTDEQDGSSTVVTELTDRQRATLKAAYNSGFFEWPRDSSGQDVADSLGVAPPTFHHHLRKAEKKIVRAALSAGLP